MIFNSLSFLIFFSLFFSGYWLFFSKQLKLQNAYILLGSYVFYAWADWRFLAFLIAVSLLNFYLGKAIYKQNKYSKFMLYIALIQGIGGLAFFRYYNFFVSSFASAFQSLHLNFNLHTLTILVPIGISFFTFKTISYVLDIKNGKIKPTNDVIVFLNYVSFFPSLLSGPIDKGRTFIPQLEKKREFSYEQATNGLRQILWGLVKKVIIADSCATMTSQIFENYQHLPASSLLLGAFLYTIEIYADFSGYSDMAIGVSSLLGFSITQNFNFPFFAQNIADFWRRWHMSLTTWLTEYVFTPLSIAFRDYNQLGLILAIVINFTICGIWHGANWTYVLFGFLHGLFFIPLILSGSMNKKKKFAKDKILPSFSEVMAMAGTFSIVMLTFVIFKSESIAKAFDFFKHLFSSSLFSKPQGIIVDKLTSRFTPLFILLLFILEWMGKEDQYGIEKNILKWNKALRWSFYLVMAVVIFMYQGKQQTFIYFQF